MTLYVRPIQAILTRDTQIFTDMDPYVVAILGIQKRITHIHKKGGKTPKWNQILVFKPNTNILTITVCDQDIISDDTVGSVKIDINKFKENLVQQTQYYQLTYKDHPAGKILLSIRYEPQQQRALWSSNISSQKKNYNVQGWGSVQNKSYLSDGTNMKNNFTQQNQYQRWKNQYNKNEHNRLSQSTNYSSSARTINSQIFNQNISYNNNNINSIHNSNSNSNISNDNNNNNKNNAGNILDTMGTAYHMAQFTQYMTQPNNNNNNNNIQIQKQPGIYYGPMQNQYQNNNWRSHQNRWNNNHNRR